MTQEHLSVLFQTALESALSKPRGREGAEMLGQQDFSTFRGGLHEFEYVIYDEVHTLDGEEGAALQRIIKGVRCNFLALSATIGNGPALRDWWQSVHDAHVADEVAEVEGSYLYLRVSALHMSVKRLVYFTFPQPCFVARMTRHGRKGKTMTCLLGSSVSAMWT